MFEHRINRMFHVQDIVFFNLFNHITDFKTERLKTFTYPKNTI